MPKKKIIISGATSSLMNAVIDLVQLQEKYHIIGITTRLRKDQRKDIEWVECKLAGTENDFSFIKDADTIIHAAAISNAYTQKDYLAVNFQSTKTLVDAANKYKLNKFIYISSVLACENCGDYGLSKAMSENHIKSILNNWLIIRPSVLYGYSEKAPIDSLIKKIAAKQIIPCPVGDPDSLTPLYYLDAARLIFDAIFVEKLSSTTKFVVGPQAFNYKGLTNEIAKSLQKKILIVPVPKVILMGLKNLIQVFGIKAGIYPDQITRLYHSCKDVKAIENAKLTPLSEYVRKQAESTGKVLESPG
ncbi:MAG: NAD(P)-dependent oxidoreductase [Bacteroidales bacterium]|nr:NAD(P)-dependent oxidoreductase [Bacteroidales bacterium]